MLKFFLRFLGIAFWLLIMMQCSVLAQVALDDQDGHFCDFHGVVRTVPPTSIKPPSDEAVNTINRLLSDQGLRGLRTRVKVHQADVKYATIKRKAGKPHIYYGAPFMQRLVKDKNDWMAVAIFAHELAHHLNDDTRNLGNGPNNELDADYFAGGAVRSLGGTLESVIVEYGKLPPPGTSHPPNDRRINALRRGFNAEDEKIIKELERLTIAPRAPVKVENAFKDNYVRDGLSEDILRDTLKDISITELLIASETEPRAAALAAWAFEKGEGGLSQNLKEAERLYTFACDKDVGRACTNLGVAFAKGEYGAKSDAKAYSFMKKACDLKNIQGCINQGVYLQEGRGADKNLSKSAELFENACRKKPDMSTGCYYTGRVYLYAYGVEEDVAIAEHYLDKACNVANTSEACNLAGWIHQEGVGSFSIDYGSANTYFKRACDNGVALSCLSLASNYSYGNGVAKDIKTAVSLYSKSCDLADDAGCYNLGLYYDSGYKGVDMDSELAKKYMKKSCDLGKKDACTYKFKSDYIRMLPIENLPKKTKPKGDPVVMQALSEGKSVTLPATGNSPSITLIPSATVSNSVGSRPQNSADKAHNLLAQIYYKECATQNINCHKAGSLYLTAKEGTPINYQYAFNALTAGCNSNMPSACFNLANMALNRKIIVTNPNFATTVHQKACSLQKLYCSLNPQIKRITVY